MSQHDQDTDFEQLAERALSRRDFIKTGIGLGLSSFVLGSGGALLTQTAHASTRQWAFEAVAANTLDTVTVPAGYEWQVVASWGDPLWAKGQAFDPQTRGTGASQELAFGDNNDGMSLFFDGKRYVMAVNNEYVNKDIIHGNRDSQAAETADDVRKSKAAHGVSVFEVKTDAKGAWRVVKDSPVSRRITADTPMEITGPARGHALMKTAADEDGALALGTFNNCGNGRTPWGTYLACEENFNGYFVSSDEAAITAEQKRYGISAKGKGYRWESSDERFDVAKHPNEANRFGYIVEIDPMHPDAMPQKRSALGRFKHENAEVTLAKDKRVVVYMGDDERGEFLYKFVSKQPYVAGKPTDQLLNDGQLFVAKFHDNGKGEWLALTPETTGMSSQAEISIHTRQAASAVGATTMDRPEWVAAHPNKTEAFCCLTNNKNRGVKPNAGGDDMPVGGPNPRAKNHYGQIVRWRSEDHADMAFAWDLFVVAGNPTVHQNAYAGSANINKHNLFNSPDGLAFDKNGMLWIQTDGKYSNKDDFANMGNNQMLVGDPESGEIRRFMVGPRQCEVTGICWTPDNKTLFVGIQHPGEKGGDSHFPAGGDSVPRSSVIAITRKDGGVIS